MKKLLALVLALVMTLSLCVVSSNAKFDDAADFTYAEAIDVMSAAGVFVGDGSGKFDAKANLTRAQAAKVIAYLDLGESVAEVLPAVSVFSDVPATHWAAKYIAYCADAEIVAGVGNGKFDPEAQVTGYQFAKMLLVVLGYDTDIEKLTGMNWSISTAKLAKENKLTNGFKGNMNTGLTREEAAQLAFRAIQARPIDHYTGYGLGIDGGKIVANSKGQAVKSTDYAALKDKLWHDGSKLLLTKHSADDKLGNPAHKWVWKNAKVGTYTDDPVLTYTTEWTWAQAKEDLAAAGVEIDTVGNNITQDVEVIANGKTTVVYDEDDMKTNIKDNKKIGGNGVVTKFYDSDDYLSLVTLADYDLVKVTDVVKDKASTKLVNESKLTFNAGSPAYYADEDTIGFAAAFEGAAKDDYFLIAKGVNKNGDPYALDIKAPEKVEGKLTSAGNKSCKLDGTSYSVAYAVTTANFGATSSTDTATLYLDEFGYAYGSNTTSVDDKTCVVLDQYQSLESGKLVTKVEVLYANGTVANLKLNSGSTVVTGKTVYNYQKQSDGTYKFSDLTTHIGLSAQTGFATKTDGAVKAGAVKLKYDDDKTPSSVVKGTKFFADDVTVVYIYLNGTSYKHVTENEVKKLADNVDVTFTVNTDGEIDHLYVFAKPVNTLKSTDGLLLLAIGPSNGTALDVDGNEIAVEGWDAYIDGELVGDFITADNGAFGRFYEIELNSDIEGAYVLSGNHYVDTNEDIQSIEAATLASAAATAKTNVINIAGDAIKVDANTQFVVTDDNTSYDISCFADLDETLNDALDGGKHNEVILSILYDDDTNVASYVYILQVVAKP